jgi:hypothetical protein
MSNISTIVLCLQFGGQTESWINTLVIGNIIITVLFIGGKIIIDALAKMIEK